MVKVPVFDIINENYFDILNDMHNDCFDRRHVLI